ncbi:methyltransferase [Candidatus Halocynthiibacter alkanivorans]|uniref:methyltransferase n=1 Tax=Candidatus Halocynthiibacter alkanivorans TaxID=2267619 RepID=UPI00135B9170|nr:methyltransferase [Candidatus Halocynthiibacter alkanivorans]
MPKLADIRARSHWTDMLQGQPQHLAMAVLMSTGALSLLALPTAETTDTATYESLLWLDSTGWARLSIALALLHQGLVALVFRLQLHRNVMSRLFGARDMLVWGWMFLPLLAARPLTLLASGLTDPTQISRWEPAEFLLGLLLLVPALWTLHSVITRFTIRRALGGDHFRDEIAELPLVRRGAFRRVPNAMYTLAFLGLWAIALLTHSWNALVLALFHHGYIWVHMYCTESPDMGWIYPRQ